MSSEVAAIRKLHGKQSRMISSQQECDDFYKWAEVEHRKDTMSLSEAASLLGVPEEIALEMISEGTLCASVDASTGAWLVKTRCVRAQLADTVPLATESATNSTQPNAYSVATKVDIMDFTPQPNISSAKPQHVEVMHATGADLVHEFAPMPQGAALATASLPATTEAEPSLGDQIVENAKEEPSVDRLEISSKNIQALMDSLDFANVRLEGSMYRIGYLEAQVHSMEEQITLMNEYRNRAAMAILKDRENDILREKMVGLETKTTTLEKQVAILEENLTNANVLLARIEQTWWYRVCARLFRFNLHESQ
jgi:hypothetical protein